jgi:hypothetical protein
LSSVDKNKLNFINFLEIFKKFKKRLKKWAKRRGGNFRLVNIENDHFLGGLFPTPLFRRLERSPIQFPIILALPRRVRNKSGPKFVIFWLSRGAPFWAPLRALLRALNSTIFNKFEKYSLLHKKVAQVVTSLHKFLQNVYIRWSSKVLKTTRFRRALLLQDLRPLFYAVLGPLYEEWCNRAQDGFNRVADLRPATPSLTPSEARCIYSKGFIRFYVCLYLHIKAIFI